MKIADTNIILRHLLKDNIEQFQKTEVYFLENEIYIPTEVIAEIVFTLLKVYQVPREDIKNSLLKIINYKNVQLSDKEVTVQSLKIFSKSNLSYIDCLLYSYNKIRNYEILSFDEELQKSIRNKKYT